MNPTTALHPGQDGFTLIELLVAMTLSLIVLIATLNSFDVFTSSAAQQNRVTSANDQARLTMDRTVRDLRNASALTRASADDLVYSVPESGEVRTERLCMAGNTLYAFSQTTATTPPPPTATCASGTRVAPLTSNELTAFSYDGAASSSTPATVKNVGLLLSLDASGGGKTGKSVLRASAAVRRTTAAVPIQPGTVTVVCTKDGPLVQVGLGGKLATDTGVLDVSYKLDGTTTISGGLLTSDAPSTPITLPKSVTSVVATLTDSLGVTQGVVEQPVDCA